MQPSSLVFVAIVGIWAAFLVQHWVRRRENMATARSVDRFSESIRMLERQPVVPSPAPRPDVRAYAVASPFVARRTTAPVSPPALGSAADGPAASVTAATGAALPTGAIAGRPAALRAPASAAPAARAARPGAPRPTRRGPRSRREILARRIRGLAFLGVLALVPVTVVLSAVGVLQWASVGVSLGCLALGIFLLRYAAVRERTRRRFDRSIAASVGRALGPERGASAPAAATRSLAEGADAASPTPAAGSVVAADAAPVEVRAGAEAATAAGTWTPVPVPRPTYTLKARVERPLPAPAEVTATPESPATEAETPATRTAAG